MLNWKTPEMVEIKMDAEISSYQEDHDPMKDGPLFIEGQTGLPLVGDSKTA